jgi:putative addiction module CopG family antidote
MTSSLPLPPHLERFVREQLAIGRFRSEGDVIRAALELLEEQASTTGPAGLQENADKPAGSDSAAPSWEMLRDRLRGDDRRSTPGALPAGRRSPRGILADLGSGISLAEIKEARHELWSGFRHDEF